MVRVVENSNDSHTTGYANIYKVALDVSSTPIMSGTLDISVSVTVEFSYE